MKAAILAAVVAATLHAAAAEAQDGVQLSPSVMQQLQEQQPEPSAPARRDGYEFRDTPDGGKDGVSYHAGDVYLGTFRRSTSPTTGRLKHWVFDRGVYVQRNGDRYSGTFYFFHFIYDELTKEPSVLPRNGTYIMVGDYLPESGAAQPGIYYGNVLNYQPMRWIEASEAYLADFERGHQEQVALYAEKIRRDRAAEAAEAESGLSFGQVLALGLGAAGIAAADIPAADALQIGSAFASDVLSGGNTSALDQYMATKQAETPAGGVTGTATGAATATAESYQQDQVTISCPSGVSQTIPLSYKTQACRAAMINFAKVYSCNMIDDFSAAASACQSACGHPQCRE